MENDINLLNTIYQNADMGIVGINEVLYKIDNKKLLKEINTEKDEYQNILDECKKIYKKYKTKPKEVGLMAKIGSEVGSSIKLMKDSSNETIIKMMIEGTYKSIGILETKKMEYKDSSKKILALNQKFIDTLNNNIERLKNVG